MRDATIDDIKIHHALCEQAFTLLAKRTRIPRPARYIESPIALPEGKSGAFEIKHSWESEFDLVTAREALLGGRNRATKIRTDIPIRIHRLNENGATWMSDLPIEVRQMSEGIEVLRPSGRVYVGGLGLGVVVALLKRNPRVTRIDVDEISTDVIALATPKSSLGCPKWGGKINVDRADVYERMRTIKEWIYDAAYFDTWRGTGEVTWWTEVMPLRRIIQRRFGKQNLGFWTEDVMLGQVIRPLVNPMREETGPYWFYRMPVLSPREAVSFVLDVGLKEWEAKWGQFFPEDF